MIEYRDVSVLRGGNAILDSVTLRIGKGERVAYLGRSGAGKTTALKVINGLIAPSTGDVIVDGTSIAQHALPSLRRRIGYVLQQPALFPHRNVLDNIATVPRLLGWEDERIRAEAERLLEQLELPAATFGARFPRMLSGGQQQRVAIARSLAMRPSVMLFDEVTSALDPETVKEVLITIRDLVHDGLTCVLVTHEMGFAREVAEHVYFTDDGGIVEHGKPAQLFAHPEHARTKAFLDQIL